MRLSFNEIPGFQVALKQENDARDAAFIADLTTDICGIPIRQMTLMDSLILDGIGNPLLGNNLPSAPQLVDFLWKLSPEFREHAPLRRHLFARRCRKINYLQAVAQIRKYRQITFQDSPGRGGGLTAAPYAGWCAHIVDRVAREYGWSKETILHTPLRQLFQYLKCIRRHHDPDCIMHNPSDKVKGDYLRLVNARNSLLNILRKRLN